MHAWEAGAGGRARFGLSVFVCLCRLSLCLCVCLPLLPPSSLLLPLPLALCFPASLCQPACRLPLLPRASGARSQQRLILRARADSHRFICKRHRIDKPSTKRLSPSPPGWSRKGICVFVCVSVSLTVCLCVCMSRLKLGKEDEHCDLPLVPLACGLPWSPACGPS